MSKSVTFSLSSSSPFSTKPTHHRHHLSTTPTTAHSTSQIKSSAEHPPNYKPQSTPQVQKETAEATSPSTIGSHTQQKSSTVPLTGKQAAQPKSTTSVQAETGQLKMENGNPSTSLSNGYKITKGIYQKGQSPPVNACTIAEKMRQQFNHQIHEHVRSIKYELASLHEHLLKLEDEIKLGNKGKNALERAINDIRKGMSVNQQSISAQQKKRRDEDSRSEVFFEEAKILTSLKRELDSRFHMMKQHIHTLDGIRKQLQNKISTLSKSSELNAHSFKVYNGPVPSNKSDDGRPRQYSTGTRQPSQSHHKDFLMSVNEGIRVSRNMRAGIKELVASAHSTKLQAHEKVAAAIAQSIERSKNHQRAICLEKGQLRLQQNAALNEAHKAELAFGMVCGPISDKYKSVAQAEDRPLMRSRPVSAMEETQFITSAKANLTRQLSAVESRRSSATSVEKKLTHSMKESSRNSLIDSQIIRARKISLDNKWVT